MTANRNPGLRVLICGGAGGVGLACAKNLVGHRLELIICDLDSTRLTVAAQELGAFTRMCDATAEHSVAIFAAEIAQKFSTIDVLINAAGRGYARTLATMRMTCAFMPMLRRASGQRLLINIAPSSQSSADGLFPYASSPAAFEQLSVGIARQARGSGIKVAYVSEDARGTPQLIDMCRTKLEAQRDQEDQSVADWVLALIGPARHLEINHQSNEGKKRAG